MSMPNGVPQSPMWFCRMTWWPRRSSVRAEGVADDRRAQVADVHLLGHVGRGVVDRDVLGRLDGTPSRGSAAISATAQASQSSVRVMLRNPGPLISTGSAIPSRSRWARIFAATSRGGIPDLLGEGQGRVDLQVRELGGPQHGVGVAQLRVLGAERRGDGRGHAGSEDLGRGRHSHKAMGRCPFGGLRVSPVRGDTVGMTDPWTLPEASPEFGIPRKPEEPVSFGDPVPPHLGELPPDIATHFPHGTDAGWRPDPNIAGQLRLWDGRHWTEHVRPLDPVAEAQKAAPPAGPTRACVPGRSSPQLMLVAEASWRRASRCLLVDRRRSTPLQIWSMQPGERPRGRGPDAAAHDDPHRILALLAVVVPRCGLRMVWIGVVAQRPRT